MNLCASSTPRCKAGCFIASATAHCHFGEASLFLDKWESASVKARGNYDWHAYYKRLFGDFDFKNKKVLDVGGGAGLASAYAIVNGAKHSTLLEPEADGSNSIALKNALAVRTELELGEKFEIRKETFQDFDHKENTFDLIVFEASINHLDEAAVTDLHTNKASKLKYQMIIEKIRSLTPDNGTVIISDCSNRNFFGDLGLRNPFVPTIEWHKHQSPNTWIRLFEDFGFKKQSLSWGIHNTLGSLGAILIGNKLAFYFISSYFILRLKTSK